MKIQQIIILIMLTSVICVFLGLILDNIDLSEKISLPMLMKTIVFGFTMIIWIYTIMIIDLYLTNRSLRKDMNTYMKCQK